MLILISFVAAVRHACAPTGTWRNNTFVGDCNELVSTNTVVTPAACCALCATNAQCNTWTFQSPTAHVPGQDWSCKLCRSAGTPQYLAGGVSSPARPTPEPPQPAPRPGAPNIIFLLTDDQDLRLGSMVAMPYTREMVLGADGAANLTNFFVNTPICCPSRATMLSGRANHNNKATSYAKSGGGVQADGMCMRMNSSLTLNPSFWAKSFVQTLHDVHGYATGMFGKVLNDMDDYGCKSNDHPPGVDRTFIMCTHTFVNCEWVDRGAPDSPPAGKLNYTGDAPDDYTTSLVGNSSLRWIKRIVEGGESGTAARHRPFFAWLGPHAPHLPSTPADWYADHPVGRTALVQEPNWGVHGADKHAFYPANTAIEAADLAAIEAENAKRLRSLLSVDDIVKGLRTYLVSRSEWSNTWMIFTSDHGYSLGGFRVDSHKQQVYDHNSRVPFVVWGPQLAATSIDIPTSMYDLAPTLIELARGVPLSPAEAEQYDGTSFAPWLTATVGASAAAWPRDAVLIEYQSLQGGPRAEFECTGAALATLRAGSGGSASRAAERVAEHIAQCSSAYGQLIAETRGADVHTCDGANNSYSALRWVRPYGTHGELLYAQFADVSNPAAWNFAYDELNFFELYNMTADRASPPRMARTAALQPHSGPGSHTHCIVDALAVRFTVLCSPFSLLSLFCSLLFSLPSVCAREHLRSDEAVEPRAPRGSERLAPGRAQLQGLRAVHRGDGRRALKSRRRLKT